MNVRVGLYSRVSTLDQAEKGYSLLAQRKILVKHAEKVKAKHVLYEDSGISGESLDRPAVRRLLDDVRARRLDRIVAVDQDRYSRNLADWLAVVDACRTAGVELATVERVLDLTSPSDIFTSHIQGAVSQYERAQIKARTMRGRVEAVRGGRYLVARPPFGYRLGDGGVLGVDLEKAEVIRRAFAMILDGKSTHTVSRALDIPRSTVKKLLRNETYTGVAHWGKRRRVGKRVEMRPPSEWIEVRVPTIVPRDEWEKAQEMLRRSAALAERNQRRFYLLKALLYCGTCGRRMYGQPDHGVRRYVCAGRLEGKCEAKAVRADRIEEVVLGEATRAIKRPDVIHELAKRYDARTSREREQARGRVESLEAQVARLPEARSRLIDAYAEGTISKDEFREKTRKLEERRRRLRDEMDRLTRAGEDSDYRKLNRRLIDELSQNLAEKVGLSSAAELKAKLKDPTVSVDLKRRLTEIGDLSTVRLVMRRITVLPDGRLKLEGLIQKPKVTSLAGPRRGKKPRKVPTNSGERLADRSTRWREDDARPPHAHDPTAAQ